MKIFIAGIALVASAAQSCGQTSSDSPTPTNSVTGVVVDAPGCSYPRTDSRCGKWLKVRDGQGHVHTVRVSAGTFAKCAGSLGFGYTRYPSCAGGA